MIQVDQIAFAIDKNWHLAFFTNFLVNAVTWRKRRLGFRRRVASLFFLSY